MALPFLRDFKKAINKLDTVSVGVMKPTQWISTGNYALNRALSGSFTRGIPLGRSVLFAGPSGCLPADESVDIYIFKADLGLAAKIEQEKE